MDNGITAKPLTFDEVAKTNGASLPNIPKKIHEDEREGFQKFTYGASLVSANDCKDERITLSNKAEFLELQKSCKIIVRDGNDFFIVNTVFSEVNNRVQSLYIKKAEREWDKRRYWIWL